MRSSILPVVSISHGDAEVNLGFEKSKSLGLFQADLLEGVPGGLAAFRSGSGADADRMFAERFGDRFGVPRRRPCR
jgi:hypothetical protein